MESKTDAIQVSLLTQDQCGFCDDAKAVLGRLESEYPLVVTFIDLASKQGQTLAQEGELDRLVSYTPPN
jgi:thiol-disulfide isomerase/thioredoxin